MALMIIKLDTSVHFHFQIYLLHAAAAHLSDELALHIHFFLLLPFVDLCGYDISSLSKFLRPEHKKPNVEHKEDDEESSFVSPLSNWKVSN